jgi:hypothetical protein
MELITSSKSYKALSLARLSDHRRSIQPLYFMSNITEWANETNVLE